MTDSRIIELFFERKDSAINELEAKYGSLMQNYASKCLSDRRDAEEVYVDALSHVWKSIPPERPRELGAYVMTVLKRRIYDKIRHLTRECRDKSRELFTEFDGSAVYGVTESAEDSVIGEKKGVLEEFLLTEEKKNRIIFVKRYYFGKTVKAIAAEMGMTDNVVSARLLRIKERLLKYLKGRGVIN